MGMPWTNRPCLFLAGAFVTGLAWLCVCDRRAAVWLHFMTSAQATPLIVAFGLIVQGVSVWKLRRAIQWKRLMPFLVGGVIGVPIGAELLRWASPGDLRLTVGAILVLFSLWNLSRRHRRGRLVQPARLAAGRAARCLSALRRRDLSDDWALARRRRHDRR
jgi:uncharacterized protein